MLCPKCNKEMVLGYLKPTGRGGIGWTKKQEEGLLVKFDSDYFKIGEAPWLKSGAAPSYNCEACKIIVLEYDK